MSDPTLLSNPSRSNGPLPMPVAVVHLVKSQIVADDAVATRAYEKFIARGRTHGRDEEDWSAAKTELIAEARGSQR
ncbi:MAG TPA: DUF2934 domain-containing protein [Polyangia bacterium]|jgi:hypothetical protein|nr:DUF2934 domain-containing protein [Polyangia bacterium]